MKNVYWLCCQYLRRIRTDRKRMAEVLAITLRIVWDRPSTPSRVSDAPSASCTIATPTPRAISLRSRAVRCAAAVDREFVTGSITVAATTSTPRQKGGSDWRCCRWSCRVCGATCRCAPATDAASAADAAANLTNQPSHLTLLFSLFLIFHRHLGAPPKRDDGLFIRLVIPKFTKKFRWRILSTPSPELSSLTRNAFIFIFHPSSFIMIFQCHTEGGKEDKPNKQPIFIYI